MEKAINIKDILSNDSYIIPRYQRNYAWGRTEISQLIKDINDYFVEANNRKSYYLGSLVCFKREDGSFELIDGQQRHTTLTLINLVLKNLIGDFGAVSKPNLKFDSRKKSQNYIEKLYSSDKDNFLKQATELNISGLGSFKDAIEIIQDELRNIKSIKNFADNFYEKVYLFRVEVPEDTDLNHYFEIMNNRGEQLEKHEIVKAQLMGIIKGEGEEKRQNQEKFAFIWDACSEMNEYVYFNFDATQREVLFNGDGNLKVNKFDDIKIKTYVESIENSGNSIDVDIDLLSKIIENREKHDLPKDFQKNEIQDKGKYKSVIDFPNFLLHVLKIGNKDVSLDDKKLLDQFDTIAPDPKEFIVDLLKYRTIFDKYVIKQDLTNADESEQKWGIRNMNLDYTTTIKTFNKENEDDEELVKLQVMLYYSDSTNTYNNWLHKILNIDDFKLEPYTGEVWNIAKEKFNKDKDKLFYPEISIFNLYFIDFLLWKLYAKYIKGNVKYIEDVSDQLNNLKKIIDKNKDVFNKFKFRQLNSREHLYSQAQAELYSIENDVINGIGNLCLISTSQNSVGNKESPVEKRKRFMNDNSSLKRIIMFESFEINEWKVDQINNHKEDINALVSYYFTNNTNRNV